MIFQMSMCGQKNTQSQKWQQNVSYWTWKKQERTQWKANTKPPHKLVRIEEIWIKKYSEDLTGKSGQNKTKHRRHHNGHERTFLFQQDSFPFSHMCNPVQMRCHTNILNCSLLPARVVIMAAGAVLLRWAPRESPLASHSCAGVPVWFPMIPGTPSYVLRMAGTFHWVLQPFLGVTLAPLRSHIPALHCICRTEETKPWAQKSC